MKTLYKFKGNKYTYNQLREIYSHSRMNKKTTFDDWFNQKILNGNIINYTEHKKCLTLEEVVNYAYIHNAVPCEIHFEHNDGKTFKVLNAELGLISVEGANKVFTYDELENKYKNEKIFNIC